MFESYRERLREQQRNPAQRRYVRRFLPLMVSYVVLLMAVMAYLRDHHPVGAPLDERNDVLEDLRQINADGNALEHCQLSVVYWGRFGQGTRISVRRW